MLFMEKQIMQKINFGEFIATFILFGLPIAMVILEILK